MSALPSQQDPASPGRPLALNGVHLADDPTAPGIVVSDFWRYNSDNIDKRHDLASDLDAVDTPSLVGVAQSAPYYHDGSAATLRALLHGRASVHGMGRTSHLGEAEIDDLVAYLETL